MRQIDFKFRTWGGRRRGAGAKPKGARAGVGHETREGLKPRHPVHVNVKLLPVVGSLRKGRVLAVLRKSFVAAIKENFRIVHYSLQSNHVHFLVEANDTKALSRGMQGLNIRMARALNTLLNRRGRVFADRFHSQALKSPKQTKHALRYVLRNFEKHSKQHFPLHWRDPFASARAPLARPKTWLLNVAALSVERDPERLVQRREIALQLIG